MSAARSHAARSFGLRNVKQGRLAAMTGSLQAGGQTCRAWLACLDLGTSAESTAFSGVLSVHGGVWEDSGVRLQCARRTRRHRGVDVGDPPRRSRARAGCECAADAGEDVRARPSVRVDRAVRRGLRLHAARAGDSRGSSAGLVPADSAGARGDAGDDARPERGHAGVAAQAAGAGALRGGRRRQRSARQVPTAAASTATRAAVHSACRLRPRNGRRGYDARSILITRTHEGWCSQC